MRATFFRHVIGGFSIGLAIGAVALVAMIWLVLPSEKTVPWGLAFVGLLEAGFIGAGFGLVTFLRAILPRDEDDQNGGELAELPRDDAPILTEPEEDRTPPGALPA